MTTTQETKHSPKIGDILSSSWGYDQTNRDYYQVVRVTPAKVALRKIKTEVVVYGDSSDEVRPVKDAFESAENACSYEIPYTSETGALRKVVYMRDGYSCKVSDYAWAHLWNGGCEFQTSSMAGH